MAGSMVAMFVVVAGLAGYIGWNFLQEDAVRPQQVASLEYDELSRVERFDQTESVEPETILPEPAAEQAEAVQEISPPELTVDGDSGAGQDAEISSDAPIAVVENPAPTTDADQILPVQAEQAVPEDVTPAPAQATAEKAPLTIEAEPEIKLADAASAPPVIAGDPVALSDTKNRPIIGTAAQALSRAPMSEIVISASATSWIEIAKANGEIVVSKLLRKGDQYVATADTDLFLSTGNAGGIQLAIGEQPAVQIGRVGEIIRDLALSRDGLSLLKSNSQF